jgi:hypothetical protein
MTQFPIKQTNKIGIQNIWLKYEYTGPKKHKGNMYKTHKNTHETDVIQIYKKESTYVNKNMYICSLHDIYI